MSTDYNISDRLYFEPLTLEHVMAVLDREKPLGVIVQLGGQTPLKLARGLAARGVPILGTSPDAIDLAEDRERFGALLAEEGIAAPEHGNARTFDEALVVARRIGFPVMVRPSYVLGGRAMVVCHDETNLERTMRYAMEVSPDHPVLLDRFLEDAVELDLDLLADGKERGLRHPAAHGRRHPLRRFGGGAAALQAEPRRSPRWSASRCARPPARCVG